MNHTPESHAEAQAMAGGGPLGAAGVIRKPPCGWCVSTHVADIACTCTEPCKDERTGQPVGWCTAIDRSDPFAVNFL